jgi:hypothetical protein
MVSLFGKGVKLLQGNFIRFILLRLFGVLAGLFLLSYQYNMENDIKLFFHHFPSVLFSVYLIDYGYSEVVTRELKVIQFSFLKRIIISFVAISIIVAVLLVVFKPIHNYQVWLIIALLTAPFQAFFDVYYRLLLKSSRAHLFLLFQAVQPLCLIFILYFAYNQLPKYFIFPVFLLSLILIQVCFLLIVYAVDKTFFSISKYNSTPKNILSLQLLQPFFLKVAPVIIYEMCSFVYTYVSPNSLSFGFELMRSSYFVVGFILLLAYTKNTSTINVAYKKWYYSALFIAVIASFISIAIAIVKYVLFSKIPFLHSLDILVFIAIALLYGIYIVIYTKWVSKDVIKIK